jgi:uncharacterized membrane protein
MKIRHFLRGVEHERVQKAIQAAEQGNSGDVVVYVSHHRVDDAMTAAHQVFRKRRLENAQAKNSLLIFIAPRSQKFAVVGGTALHEKVGQMWWDELSAVLARHFREDRYTEGLVAALEKSGEALRIHFPDNASDRTGQQDIVEE